MSSPRSKMSKAEQVEDLHNAIKNEEMHLFNTYMKDPVTQEIIDEVDDDGYTALYLACRSGKNRHEKVCLGMVVDILKLNAKVDAKGDDRETPLYIATHNHLVTVVKYLLNAGAKVNEMNGAQGDTALHCASKYGYTDLIKVLLLEGNANLNARNTVMETPLYAACKAGRYEAVYELLSKDANKNLMDQDGKNALFIASEKGHKSCVSLLKVEKEYLKDAKSAADVEERMAPASLNDPKQLAKRAEQAKDAEEAEARKARAQPMPQMIRIEDVEPKQHEERTHDPLTGKKLPPAFKSMVGSGQQIIEAPAGVVKPKVEESYGGTSVATHYNEKGKKIKNSRAALETLGQDEATAIFDVYNVKSSTNATSSSSSGKKAAATTADRQPRTAGGN